MDAAWRADATVIRQMSAVGLTGPLNPCLPRTKLTPILHGCIFLAPFVINQPFGKPKSDLVLLFIRPCILHLQRLTYFGSCKTPKAAYAIRARTLALLESTCGRQFHIIKYSQGATGVAAV